MKNSINVIILILNLQKCHIRFHNFQALIDRQLSNIVIIIVVVFFARLGSQYCLNSFQVHIDIFIVTYLKSQFKTLIKYASMDSRCLL